MKTRTGFVSNSSSSSFIITNKTDKPLDLLELAKDALHILKEFNEEYGHSFTEEEFLKSAKDEKTTVRPGAQEMIFGDEDGTVIGQGFDYGLRNGSVNSERFSTGFNKHCR